MPYLKEGRKKEFLTEPQRANTPGDYNYLFTEAILKVWNANPRYETIHRLKAASKGRQPFVKEIADVYLFLTNLTENQSEVDTALELAFLEFYLRIGQHYEREKRNENGDLEGYEIATKHLNEMARENFNKRIGFKETK